MSTFRTKALSALLAASTSLLGLPAGLDPATQARFTADKEAIRKADAARRAILLAQGTNQSEQIRVLEEFREQRRKAFVDAVETLLAVRESVPKDEWKAIVAEVAAGGSMPFLADQARQELPAVVADPARRAAADKTLADIAAALKAKSADPESGGKKFLALLEKKSSTRDDFITAMEKLTEAQEKLDQKVVDGISSLQRILTPEEWAEFVRRLATP